MARARGAADCLDRFARPHNLPRKATEEEHAIVCALRRGTNFPLDDLTFVVCHLLPHLNRDSSWRILKAEGLKRRPKPFSKRPAKNQGTSAATASALSTRNLKHLPKLQTDDGERRKRHLFVAIDRCSRSVHLAVKDDETERSAIAVLHEAAAAFPFQLTHVLTDNGSCFTPAFAKACTELSAPYWHTRPRKPQTNGMVKRFNGRISSEVLSVNIYSHRALEQPLRDFDTAYKTPGASACWPAERQAKSSPNTSRPSPNANPAPHGCAGPCDVTKARLIANAVNEASRSDKARGATARPR